MTKKVLYTDFTGIDNILEDISKNPKFKKAITKSNLFKFWNNIIGEKFIGKSKPFSMTTNSVMIIACKNSAVAQELQFQKQKIFKDFQPYLKSLKLNIKDLRFDTKRWREDE